MNENKVPCGGFEVDTESFAVREGKFTLEPSRLMVMDLCMDIVQP